MGSSYTGPIAWLPDEDSEELLGVSLPLPSEEDELPIPELELLPLDDDITVLELLLGVSSSLPDEQEKASTIASPKAAVNASLASLLFIALPAFIRVE
jgi:hypothetical protein